MFSERTPFDTFVKFKDISIVYQHVTFLTTWVRLKVTDFPSDIFNNFLYYTYTKELTYFRIYLPRLKLYN